MIIGLEHEYEIHCGGRQRDARQVLSALDLTGRRLDPGDPHAVRLGWGGIITADGLSDAAYAVFDRNGRYLYFTASTDVGGGHSITVGKPP